MSNSDHLYMVRLYNTLSVNSKFLSQDKCSEFYHLYSDEILRVSVTVLEAKITKGWAYYSKKYNVYIGGPEFHANSQYIIK